MIDASGPLLPFAVLSFAAARLSSSCHPNISQQFRRSL